MQHMPFVHHDRTRRPEAKERALQRRKARMAKPGVRAFLSIAFGER